MELMVSWLALPALPSGRCLPPEAARNAVSPQPLRSGVVHLPKGPPVNYMGVVQCLIDGCHCSVGVGGCL